MSLTEVMLGGAVLAGLGLAAAQLFKDQRNSQRRIELDQTLSSFHGNLARLMNRSSNCNATMKMILANGSQGIPIKTSVAGLYKCTDRCFDDNAEANLGFDAFTSGAYLSNNNMLVSNNQFIDGTQTWKVKSITIPEALTRSGSFRFTLTYELTIPAFKKSVSKDIVLNARFNGSVFMECINGQESSVNNLNNDMCKTWNLNEDPGSPTDIGKVSYWDSALQTCVILGRKDCTDPGMRIKGIRSDGIIECEKVVGSTDASNLEDDSTVANCSPSQKAQVYFDSVQKKIKVQCVNINP
jgi:hypothetical protein